VVDYMVHLLATRLKLIADRKLHPEIARQEIRRPMIVVGPPRTGSTLLHTLLSLDPDHMSPEHWNCLEPSPPLALGAPSRERLDRAEKRMMALFEQVPDIFVTHPYMIEEGAGALAECGSDILNMVFTCQQLWCFYRGESYRRYLLEADHTVALGFHHDFLQHLQWGNKGKCWALKGSDHMLWLGEIAAQYPDAMLLWTHRDLAQQLGSLANIQSILCGLTGYPVSGEAREAVGRLAIEHQRASLQKGMSARDRIGEDRFFDVSYHDVMANPVRTVERIYERFGLKMSEQHVAAIRDWLERNPQTKHGAHKYSSEEFGLEADAINRRFKDYVDRFGFGFDIRPSLME
jgi:Sulfotransferase family